MNLSKIAVSVALVLGIVSAPALALAHESKADLDADVSSSIGVAHPNVTSGILLGGDGQVIVNQATVGTVGSTSLSAQSKIGSTIFNWILNTGSSTTIKETGTSSASLASIKAGDTISFAGLLSSIGSTFTVQAEVIRDWMHTAATTTASTTVSHEDKGKNVGWFKNWFQGIFKASVKANVHAGK